MASSDFPVVVRQAYAAQYTDPIAFRCGDVIQVERPDPVFAEWFWCRGPDGRQGFKRVIIRLPRPQRFSAAGQQGTKRECASEEGDPWPGPVGRTCVKPGN
jgi:hypothetical protein